MTEGIKTVIYPVKDLAAAKQIFGRLAGVEPYSDEAYYVGFKVDGQDVGLDPKGHDKGMAGPVGYWHVDDIDSDPRRADRSRCSCAEPGSEGRRQPAHRHPDRS